MTSGTAAVALEAPRWALRFSRRHLPLVLGLCLVAAVERFTGQLTERTAAEAVLAEVTTTAARLGLAAVAVRAGILRDDAVGPFGQGVASRRVTAFFRRDRRAIAAQAVGLCLLVVVADVLPERVVPALVEVGPHYWAWLLGLKNLTVIPFTLLWTVGFVRQMLRVPDGERVVVV